MRGAARPPSAAHAAQAAFDYYLGSQPGMFVLPIAELTPAGMSASLAGEIQARRLMTADACALFDASFSLYQRRATDLYRRVPGGWLPARIQHVCVATGEVRPYFEPFHRNSWLFYASDFAPATSSVEFATFLFFQVERMGFQRAIAPALLANVSYFLALDEEETAGFVAGCARTTRPDAAGYRGLAARLPLIRTQFEPVLRPAQIAMPLEVDPRSGLQVTKAGRAALDELENEWTAATTKAIQAHRRGNSSPATGGGAQISRWLADIRPALVVSAGEETLWHPGEPEAVGRIEVHLARVSEAASRSVLSDLAVVDRCTRLFLDCVRDQAALAEPAPYITAGGLSHIERDHRLVAYDLGPGENESRLWEPTPPYERLMLAARTVHEWGHMAAESGWVFVPKDDRPRRRALLAALADALDELHASAPPSVRTGVAGEAGRHAQADRTLGQGILRSLRQRIEDYMANLLAHRILDANSMDTYVLNNVASRAGEYQLPHVFHELARAVYELQYLRLARIAHPIDWYFRSTWFRERFVEPGIVSEARFVELATLLAEACDLYVIDETRLDLSAHPARRLGQLGP